MSLSTVVTCERILRLIRLSTQGAVESVATNMSTVMTCQLILRLMWEVGWAPAE